MFEFIFLYIITLSYISYNQSGGYMFPIRGLILKKDHAAPWVVYNKENVDDDEDKREKYEIIAALPPCPTPARPEISELFTR